MVDITFLDRAIVVADVDVVSTPSIGGEMESVNAFSCGVSGSVKTRLASCEYERAPLLGTSRSGKSTPVRPTGVFLSTYTLRVVSA